MTSYVLGLGVIAQYISTNGMLYLLTDGHGSTRALTTSNGSISSGQIYDYDAFGTPLDFDPASAKTTWLFVGMGSMMRSMGGHTSLHGGVMGSGSRNDNGGYAQ